MSTNDKKSKNNNIHKGHRKRMRDKLLRDGIDVLDDHEVLEFLLYNVHRTKNTNAIGHALMDKFKSLGGVFCAQYEELIAVDGLGEAGAAFITLVSQLTNRLSRDLVPKEAVLPTNEAAGRYCMSLFRGAKEESMIVVCVDSERKVLSWDTISKGDTVATKVDMRKIVRVALNKGASGVIITHNHPGDTTYPSGADMAMTSRITSVLEAINISVVDHIICNDETYTSMSEKGFLDKL